VPVSPQLCDPADPRLAPFRDLLTRRPGPHEFFAESEVAVARLLASPHFHTHAVLGTAPHLARLAIPPSVPALLADRPLLKTILGFDLHRGVIAHAERPAALAPDLSFATCPIGPVLGATPLLLNDILAAPRWTVLLVQGLADPQNLGSILRSARAFAVDLVVLDRRGADPLERRAIRAAMGHGFAQPLALAADLHAAVTLLKSLGASILAATVSPRAVPVNAVPRVDRQVLMVGNEGDGLPPALLAAADLELTIPISPEVDSLGVAAATAVLLHALKPSPGPGADCL